MPKKIRNYLNLYTNYKEIMNELLELYNNLYQ